MSSISEASIELEKAVEAMLSLFRHSYGRDSHGEESGNDNEYDDDISSNESFPMNSFSRRHHQTHRNQSNSNRNSNTYERKRALRRLQRALVTFEMTMDEIQDQSLHQNINDDEHNCPNEMALSDEKMISLNESMLNLLIDILTEVPSVLPSFSFLTNMSMESLTCSDKNDTGVTTTTTLSDQLYNDEIVPITCSLIQKYALLPINQSFVDKILDHVASIISKTQSCRIAFIGGGNEQYFLNLIRIINTSVLAQDQEIHQLHQLQQEQKRQSHQQASQRINNHLSTLFLLSANETIALTQLFLPLSLKYLSYPWQFVASKPDLLLHIEHDTSHQEKTSSRKTGNDIIEIDDMGRVIHLSSDYDGFGKIGENGTHGKNYEDDDVDNTEKDIQQECSVQIRVLLGYLFRHLSCLLRPCVADGDDKVSVSVSLEDSLVQLFHSNHHEGQESERGVLRDRQLLVEDYIDLVSSFVIESIEYSIDIIDSASHFLRRFVTSNKSLDLDGTVENVQQIDQHIGQRSEKQNDYVLEIRRHVKDTIRHCSIAIGMIELFFQDMKLHNIDSNGSSQDESIDSHLISLYRSYAQFVASFCTDDLLHGTFCWSNSCDVVAVSSLFDSADNVLFRLSDTLLRMNNGTDDSNEDAYEVLTVDKNKKRKVNKMWNMLAYHNVMDTVTIAVFLRAFQFSRKNCLNIDPHGTSSSIFLSTMRDMSSIIQRMYSVDNGSSTPTNENSEIECTFAGNATSLIQACALSTLVLSDSVGTEQSNYDNSNQQSGEEYVLASLVSSLMKDGEAIESKARHGKPEILIDALNPWSYLLSTKIAEKSPWTRGGDNISEPQASLPMTIFSTSSVSSVSDLKSNIASISSSKSGEIVSTPLDSKRTILAFIKAMSRGFDTTRI